MGTKYIFVTYAEFNGKLSGLFGEPNPILAADYACNHDSRPGVPPGEYKAMLVDNFSRSALDADGGMSPTWVMAPNATYVRSKALGGYLVAALTDGQGLVRYDGGLKDSLDFVGSRDAGIGGLETIVAWTGFDGDYQATKTCEAWRTDRPQSPDGDPGGIVAFVNGTNPGALGAGYGAPCDQPARLVCVQQ